jgi:steroid 5-alpha reductase family enzyme
MTKLPKYFGHFFTWTKLCIRKMSCPCTFWAIFSKTHLVTLLVDIIGLDSFVTEAKPVERKRSDKSENRGLYHFLAGRIL